MKNLLKDKKSQFIILLLLAVLTLSVIGFNIISDSDEDDDSSSSNGPTSSPVSPPEVISDTGNVEDDETDQDSRNDEDTSEEVVIPAFPTEDSVHPKQEETWTTYKDKNFNLSFDVPNSANILEQITELSIKYQNPDEEIFEKDIIVQLDSGELEILLRHQIGTGIEQQCIKGSPAKVAPNLYRMNIGGSLNYFNTFDYNDEKSCVEFIISPKIETEFNAAYYKELGLISADYPENLIYKVIIRASDTKKETLGTIDRIVNSLKY